MPDRPQQPVLTRLGSNLPKSVKKAVAVARFLSAIQSNQLSPAEQERASVQMTQAKDKTSASEKWLTDAERAAAIEQPDTYTGGLNKKPEEEQTSLDVSGQSESKDKKNTDPQSEDQRALNPEPSTPARASEASPTISPRQRTPSPLEKRRMLEQIKSKEAEIADLESKTGSTRRKEKMDNITKDIIKMAALSETFIGSIYYFVKILIREGFAHKDGAKVRQLKQEITDKKTELTGLKRQAHQMQITR